MVQYSRLDEAFGALSDPTRRGILERLGRGPATVTELAEEFGMTLTGVKKHIQLLERAGMAITEKRGRVRCCRLGDNALDQELAWITGYRSMIADRLERLAAFLDTTEDEK